MAKQSLLPAPRDSGGAIGYLVTGIRRYLHMPDPSILYVLMGAVAGNLMDGYPVWLMLVGPPSDGKTELLNSLLGISGMHELANISNESAFLSATTQKERAKDATGGILRQVGDHGGVVMNDFTSVLGLDNKTLGVILSVFRESYSGRWTRHVGVDGGRQIRWVGKVAFFGGVTGEIDRHQQINAALGERWIYYRMGANEVVTYEKARRALLNAGRPVWREELRDLVASFFAGLDLWFGESEGRRDLTDQEANKIIRLATVAARCRSAVVRDAYTKEIMGVRETEAGTRLATILGQLLVGMEVIGVEERERWRLVGKVGLDSMPKIRRAIVDGVLSHGREGVTTTELAAATGASKSVVDRAVEDLEVHGVVVGEVREDRKRWVVFTEGEGGAGEELRRWRV